MSALESQYIKGYCCNARNCEERLEGEEIEMWTDHRNGIYKKRGIALGWSCWSSRSVYHYCPEHGPGKVHQMRQVW